MLFSFVKAQRSRVHTNSVHTHKCSAKISSNRQIKERVCGVGPCGDLSDSETLSPHSHTLDFSHVFHFARLGVLSSPRFGPADFNPGSERENNSHRSLLRCIRPRSVQEIPIQVPALETLLQLAPKVFWRFKVQVHWPLDPPQNRGVCADSEVRRIARTFQVVGPLAESFFLVMGRSEVPQNPCIRHHVLRAFSWVDQGTIQVRFPLEPPEPVGLGKQGDPPGST